MKITAIFSAFAVILLFATVVPFNGDGSDGANTSGKGNRYQATQYFDVPVRYVTSDGSSSRSACLVSVTENVEVSNALSSVSKGMVFIDKSWTPSKDQKEELSDIIMSGVPVISIGSSELFTDKDIKIGAVAFSETSIASGFYYDQKADVRYCYSVECDSIAEASLRMYNWGGDMMENGVGPSGTPGIPPAGSIVSSKDLRCGNQGWLNIRTYYTLVLTEPGVHYWVVHYYTETVPDSGNYTTRTNVKNKVNKYTHIESGLLAHGPNTTSGSSTASVGISAGSSGSSVSAGRSYSIPDVSVVNKSNLALNYMEIEHNIVCGTNASKSTYFSEPGMTFWCENISGHAHVTEDTYEAVFCKRMFGIDYGHTTYSTMMRPILYDDR